MHKPTIFSRPKTPDPSQYLLRVTAGPSYAEHTHVPVAVNSPEPTTLVTPTMTVTLRVQIRSYAGLPLGTPRTPPYFAHAERAGDRSSISFSFVPHADIPAATALWGNDFDHPIRDRLPPGTSWAIRFVREWVDPGLEVDAWADEPWLYAPGLSTWPVFRVGAKREGGAEAWLGRGHGRSGGGEAECKGVDHLPLVEGDEDYVLEEGGEDGGEEVRSRVGMPVTGKKRRHWFLERENRERFAVFEKGRLYQADFFNPFIDFSKLALRLPGFSLSVLKYVDDKTHKLRYVFRDGPRRAGEKDGEGRVYFVIVMTLMFGEELEKAMAEEQARGEKGEHERAMNGYGEDQLSGGRKDSAVGVEGTGEAELESR